MKRFTGLVAVFMMVACSGSDSSQKDAGSGQSDGGTDASVDADNNRVCPDLQFQAAVQDFFSEAAMVGVTLSEADAAVPNAASSAPNGRAILCLTDSATVLSEKSEYLSRNDRLAAEQLATLPTEDAIEWPMVSLQDLQDRGITSVDEKSHAMITVFPASSASNVTVTTEQTFDQAFDASGEIQTLLFDSRGVIFLAGVDGPTLTIAAQGAGGVTCAGETEGDLSGGEVLGLVLFCK